MVSDNKKKVILEKHGFELMEGFIMDYDKPEEDHMLSVFISKEEWFKRSLEGFEEYWWNGKTERLMNLEEAWEFLCEDIWDEKNFTDEMELESWAENEYAKHLLKLNNDQ